MDGKWMVYLTSEQHSIIAHPKEICPAISSQYRERSPANSLLTGQLIRIPLGLTDCMPLPSRSGPGTVSHPTADVTAKVDDMMA